MLTIATTEPTQIVQGDTTTWLKEVPNVTPSDYVLTYELRGPAPITLSASDNGDGRFKVDVAKTVTSTWNAGQYWWESYATAIVGGARSRVGYGLLDIGKDFAKPDAEFDGRSFAVKARAKVETAILQFLDANLQAYSVGGNQFQKPVPHELLEARARFLAEERQERILERQRLGQPSGTSVLVTM